jgi:hypothetical protein
MISKYIFLFFCFLLVMSIQQQITAFAVRTDKQSGNSINTASPTIYHTSLHSSNHVVSSRSENISETTKQLMSGSSKVVSTHSESLQALVSPTDETMEPIVSNLQQHTVAHSIQAIENEIQVAVAEDISSVQSINVSSNTNQNNSNSNISTTSPQPIPTINLNSSLGHIINHNNIGECSSGHQRNIQLLPPAPVANNNSTDSVGSKRNPRQGNEDPAIHAVLRPRRSAFAKITESSMDLSMAIMAEPDKTQFNSAVIQEITAVILPNTPLTMDTSSSGERRSRGGRGRSTRGSASNRLKGRRSNDRSDA